VIEGLREVQLNDKEQGELRLLVATPRAGDAWGVLAPLRKTPWERIIRVVPGEALSHALHGYATPLVRALGPDPRRVGRRLTEAEARCVQHKTCLSVTAKCRAGSDVPYCFDAGTPEIASVVVVALHGGWHVVVVEGPEFSLG